MMTMKLKLKLNDEWAIAAMSDDTVVAHLLLRLKKSDSHKSQPVPLTWGHKQPRSKSHRTTSTSRCESAVSTRCSPTTPLSWSGGASPSATFDGCEESTRHHAARSKATATSGYTGNSASTKKKRCRRKKTIAQLKEEESSLLKERTYLKKKIANVNANCEAQRAENKGLTLKRMKLDYESKYENSPSSTTDELQCTVSGQPHQRIVQDDSHSQASDSKPIGTESTGGSVFLIPDLNMMPSDDGSSSYAQCGRCC